MTEPSQMTEPGHMRGSLSEWRAGPPDGLIEESVPQVLARQADRYGERPAVYADTGDTVEALTYGELRERATTLARVLAARTSPGDRLGVWSVNSFEWVVLEYASALAGLVLTPFNPLWTDAEAAHARQLTEPVLIFAGPGRTGESLAGRAAAIAGDHTVVDIADLGTWTESAPQARLPSVGPDDPFLIQFTSGTTGRSKGAVHSHRSALNAAHQRNRADVIRDDDCYLNAVPFHHVGGSIFVILGGLVDAGAFVLLERWDPEQVIAMMRSGVVTRIGGVPTMMTDLLERLGDEAGRFTLASVSLGGAESTETLVRRVGEVFGARVVVTYGQSECPTITTTPVGADPRRIATTVGRPMTGVDLRIVSPESGEPVPVGTAGEIVVRAPYVMRGYWDMPGQTAEVFTSDGFLRTGDLGRLDDQGYLTFQGRARDVIIRGGENIYPQEVEEVLLGHPGVAMAVVVGMESRRLGEEVAGVVVPTDDAAVTGEELAEYLADKVARFKIPIVWRFVESLPVTAAGKIKRFVVREDTNAAAGDTAGR